MNRQAQGPWIDLAIHTIGWKAFQDLCAQICEEILKRPVEIYREAQDGGQDAVFISKRNGKLEAATIQCKFSSNADRRLKSSDLNAEISNIDSLVKLGEADTYAFITSMGVDASVAQQIKAKLRTLGVKKPHVFGREFICKSIRASSRLRALVPQVYGLGDLSLILDERKAAQTQALLKNWLPTLKIYVPTNSHRKAVRALSEHGIVLLLGNPATGKSTIAAILSAMACESGAHSCFKVDGPKEFSQHWNPHEKDRFYWIDDAFGANQLRDEYIHDWAENLKKMHAAISDGNRFVLTSRRHIYEEAKVRLGTRNLPLFLSEVAVVNVGSLALEERQQILYNQIKAGNQKPYWKKAIKPHLEAIASETRFLPGIAKRLADSAFTKNLKLNAKDLINFFREPKEHLINTIRELSVEHQAALAAIFIHRGRMLIDNPDSASIDLICNEYGIDKNRLNNALRDLNGSFVLHIEDAGKKYWTFEHPTIFDAITDTFRRHAEKSEMFVRGAKLETVLSNVACTDILLLEDAMTIQKNLEPILINRIAEHPDDPTFNDTLFSFLNRRASDDFFIQLARRIQDLFSRETKSYWASRKGYDSKFRCLARAHSFGLLSESMRLSTSYELETSLIDYQDTSFLDDDQMLSIISPRRLLNISFRIKNDLLRHLQSEIEQISNNADLDIDPENNFDDLQSSIEDIRNLFESDADVLNFLTDIDAQIGQAIEEISIRKQEHDFEKETDDHVDWKFSANWRSSPPSLPSTPSHPLKRSIFSDIDE